MSGKLVKRNKLINLISKECLEYWQILSEYRQAQLFFAFIGNMRLNALVYVDLECVTMTQRKRFLNYMLLLVHGHCVLNFQYNKYF